MEEKIFVSIGYQVYHLTQKELALIKELYKNNNLKFEPKIITIYGYEEKKGE